MGFNSHEQFRIFGRELVGGLRQAGYEDALPYMRGSAVTGRSYDQGELLDAGRVSDYDLAIVSPSMMRRAEELGIRTSNQGARTRPLDENDLNAIGIRATADGLGASANRPVSFMVYRSVNDVARRGPFVTVP